MPAWLKGYSVNNFTMQDLNEQIISLPFFWHLLASSIVIIMYSHAWIGFLRTRHTLKPPVRLFMWLSLSLTTFYFCNRYSQPENVLDVYYLRWWVVYFQSLFIMKRDAIEKSTTFTQLWHNLFKFDTCKTVKPH